MRSGFVTFVGRPNVGKSTLVNRIVGTKVAITSDKPQTTRTRIMGVLTRPDAQVVFVDTPGIHKPRTPLGSRLNATAEGTIGPVTAIPLKIQAAFLKHLRRVVIPDTLDVTDADWFTPFLMQVSPIHTAATAYQALTDHSFLSQTPALPAP